MKLKSSRTRVMVAGVGGASLGTEIYKSLRLAGSYDIFGCDVSPTAYGLYEPALEKTYRVQRENYSTSVLNACLDANVRLVIPGGEQPMQLIGAASRTFAASGIHVVANSPEVITRNSDKSATFAALEAHGIPIPKTTVISKAIDLDYTGLPCVVKPVTGSGGSAGVFFALSVDEAMIYADYIRRTDRIPIAQEYINDNEGEFTIGVLSLSDGRCAGSIALRREFDAKLSVAYRGRGGLISSGYSQGFIGDFPDLRRQAEQIAVALGSVGPLNVQGRVRGGVLLPFEVNPRFSASTYLRAMAGFNEVDLFIDHLITGRVPMRPKPVSGWYLRSLSEQFVPEELIK